MSAKGNDLKVYFVPEGSPVVPDRFDVRIRLRSLTRGIIRSEEVAKYLKGLPDDAASGEVRSYAEVTGEEDPETSASDLN